MKATEPEPEIARCPPSGRPHVSDAGHSVWQRRRGVGSGRDRLRHHGPERDTVLGGDGERVHRGGVGVSVVPIVPGGASGVRGKTALEKTLLFARLETKG
jgi:hypothetical protein